MLDILFERCELSLSSVALAHIYFERLAASVLVTKENSDVVAAVVVLLAVKFNEDKSNMSEHIQKVCIQGTTLVRVCHALLWFGWQVGKELDDQWGVSWKDVIEAEADVFVDLQYSLHVDQHVLAAHVHRIASALPDSSKPKAAV
jgi:hypothetical protein